jgi:short-subunit dehydrogenase
MERVLILGATSAIAAEVCALHAALGDRLHLVGRNRAKLDAVAARCEGTRVSTAVADFVDLGAAEAVVADAVEALGGSVDRCLIAHGELGDQLATERTFEDAEAVLRTNFTSVVSLLIPLANRMEAARRGRIGVITSVAGERGRPRNYTYGAAKGALNVYLQGLRTRLYPSGVKVTTLKLGPVDTPMTRDHAKHPLFGRAPAVARDIVRAMDRGAAEVYVPRVWGAIMPMVRATPERLFQLLPFLSGR